MSQLADASKSSRRNTNIGGQQPINLKLRVFVKQLPEMELIPRMFGNPNGEVANGGGVKFDLWR